MDKVERDEARDESEREIAQKVVHRILLYRKRG
jgi:hypothetical protein